MTILPGHRYITRDGWITPPLRPDLLGGANALMGSFGFTVEPSTIVAEYHEPGWVQVSDRLPTEADTDETGGIIWKWASGSTLAGKLDSRSRVDGLVAWHPLAKYSPPAPREIEAHGRTYVLKEDK